MNLAFMGLCHIPPQLKKKLKKKLKLKKGEKGRKKMAEKNFNHFKKKHKTKLLGH